jgi:hypothetical protein
VELIDITAWTHEDVMAMAKRVSRFEGDALQLATHMIFKIQSDNKRDALRMEIWRADRTKIAGWGDFFTTPAESAISDMKVLRTAREIARGSY